MRINAVINSQTVREEIPEKIKVSDNESLFIKETTVVISEFDRSTTPFVNSGYEKGFSVGVKALVERRRFADNSVTVAKDQIGHFVYIPEDTPIKDAMDVINDLIRKISEPNA